VPFNYTFRGDDMPSLTSEVRDLLENRDRELELFLQLAVNPTGAVLPYAGVAAPSGYLLCDGSTFDGDQYPELRDCVGDTYGVHSGNLYYLPNLKGRIPVGRDAAQTEFDAMGETGGAKTHTLAQTEMPVHTHVQNAHGHVLFAVATSSDGSHVHDYTTRPNNVARDTNTGAANTSSTTNVTDQTGSAGTHSHTVTGITLDATATNQNAGSGAAHNNLQPYVVLNYIIKT
jgi:microcystin-dependent protein